MIALRLTRGARYMVASAFAFSIMTLLVKVAGRTLPAQEIVLARVIVGLVLSWAILRRAGLSPWGNRRNRPLLVVRGLFGFGGLFCFYWAVSHGPVAEVTVLHFTNPVFTAVLATLVLAERAGRRLWISIPLGLAGLVLVTRPALVFGVAPEDLPLQVALVALAGAVFSAGAYVVVRRLSREEHPLVIVFWFPLVAVPVIIPIVAPVAVWPSPLGWLVLIGVGVFTQIGQVTLTRGLQHETAGRATAISYLQVALATLWGLFFFGESPDLLAGLGALLILSGTLVAAAEVRTGGAGAVGGSRT